MIAIGTPLRRLTQRIARSRARSGPTTASDRLFHGLRLRLTLWYGGVLALSLLLAGIGLYLVLQHLLLQPIKDDVSRQIDQVRAGWLHDPSHACGAPFGPPPKHDSANSPIPFYVACFDATGAPLSNEGTTSIDIPAAFSGNALALRALNNGAATDHVEGGANAGTIYRAADVVRDPANGTVLGVVQVGRSIEEQESALRLLRSLLLALGVVAVLVATVGGLFLASRALLPARLAFARQQHFIGDASHELRTPLTILRANAELLLRHREQLPADASEMLGEIVEETEHIDHISSELLLLARLDAGQLHLEREVVDLATVAANVARRVAPIAAEKGISLERSELGSTRLLGDAEALERAALILLDNAVKYTPPGGRVELRTALEDGNATLTVADSGIGIDAAHLPHLTERFYRVDRARSRETGGAGLGLSIAHGIANAHAGRLLITSEPGQGTLVRIVLPMNVVDT